MAELVNPAENPEVSFTVIVADSSGNPANGALVMMGGHGGAQVTLTTSGASDGYYSGSQAGVADAYDLSITFGADALTGVVLVSPGEFELALDPDPPTKGSGAMLRWRPFASDAFSSAFVNVYAVGGAAPTFSTQQYVADSGEQVLPASTFPFSTTYNVEVTRSTGAALALPVQSGSVSVLQIDPTTVP